MGNAKEKKSIYIVHSVKGGSGKTAFSLFKSIELAIQEKKTRGTKANIANVLYVDADFKGSATKTLLYGKDCSAFQTMNEITLDDITDMVEQDVPPMVGLAYAHNYQPKTINDFFRGKESFVKEVITNGGLYFDFDEHDSKLCASLDFAFSSPRANDKKMFYYEAGEEALPLLNIGWYRVKIGQFLDQLLKDAKYDHIVIDMPPGDDEYSRELIKVLDTFYINNKVNLYWYSVTTNDDGHLDSECEDLLQRLRPDSRREPYNQYVMVYNELNDGEFNEATINSCVTQLRELLKSSADISETNIKYLKNVFCRQYYQFCRKDKRGLEKKSRGYFYNWEIGTEKSIFDEK
ncbi:MAG: hypothetical protein MRZ65_01020 [Lachnospiraceae bacterium]|nr:hypothetical protein [Lachnospiraceae bacterium]